MGPTGEDLQIIQKIRPPQHMSAELKPFRIEVSEVDLRDLRQRLKRTRWPEREIVEDWSQGVPLAYLRELCRYLGRGIRLAGYRGAAKRASTVPHGDRRAWHPLPAHPLAARRGAAAHNYARLARVDHRVPEGPRPAHRSDCTRRRGGRCLPRRVPVITGYGFSDKPAQRGWGVEWIAAAWTVLMGRLGYKRYGAQGSDWGTSVSASIGQQDPDHVAGIHLTPPLAPPDRTTFDDLTERERAALASLEHSAEWDSGYSREHATRPQTIGYALVDSPAALCAWIIEKFWAWTDCDGHLENLLTREELLDNLMLYWLPRTGASSARLYWESIRRVNEWISGPTTDTVAVPTGCSIFPKELQRPSRRWAEKRFLDIRYLERARPGRTLRRLRAARVVRGGSSFVLSAGAMTAGRAFGDGGRGWNRGQA